MSTNYLGPNACGIASSPAAVPEGALPPLPDEEVVRIFNRVQGRWSSFGGPLNAILKFAAEVVAADRAQQGEPVGLDAILRFLMGEGELEGVKFGERHPTKAGAFWWRLNLRAAMHKARGERP